MYKFIYKNRDIDPTDIYQQHQQIWKNFSDSTQCPKFRVDGITVTVLNDKPPTENIACSMTKIPAYKNGDTLKFRWRGCVDRVKSEGGRKRTISIEDMPGKLAWAKRVSEANGFSITDYVSVSSSYPLFGMKGEHKIVCNAVDFEGTLTVTNETVFNEAVCGGAGSSKLGLGMILIQN